MAGLLDYIEETKGDPFEWGRNDCVLWAATFIERVSGIDPARKLRGKYTSSYSAKRLIAFNGGLERICADAMSDFPPGEDAVIVIHEGRSAIGLKAGCGVAVKDAVGIGILNSPEILMGWRVWSS